MKVQKRVILVSLLLVSFIFLSSVVMANPECDGDCEVQSYACASPNTRGDDIKEDIGCEKLQEMIDDAVGLDVDDTNSSASQTQFQVWDFNEDIVELEIEFIGGTAKNNNSFFYYADDGSQVGIFQPSGKDNSNYPGLEELSPGETVTISVRADRIGFGIDSQGSTGSHDSFYTETSKNSDGMDHAVVYNVGYNKYLIAFEDLSELGDRNYEDMVVVVSVKDCWEGEAPTCTVDFLEDYELVNPITYITESGDFFVYGTASDADSKITNLQYNRSSPNQGINLVWPGQGAESEDGNFDELFEDWKSDWRDDEYTEGEHNICCRATDAATNLGYGECKNICIDTQDPVVENLVITPADDCDGTEADYFSEGDVEFSWDSYDVGCAGVDYHEIEIYKGGVLIDTTWEDASPMLLSGLSDGEYYFIIKAVDKAGNEGSSVTSKTFIVDTTDPEVTIDSPADGAWFNTNFNLTETDSDVNLLSCEYQIDDLGWNAIVCNEILPVDIEGLAEGDHTMAKKAKDKACNEYSASVNVKIDTTAPETTKVVGERKYLGREWFGWLLDWFITDETSLTFSCDDGLGIGCDITYFTIYNATGAIVREGDSTSGSFDVTMNLPDGVYNVTYYSVDGLGNVEDVQWEIDKVDSEAPVTIRTVTPSYDDGETVWINCEAEESYECTDSGVGCNYTEETQGLDFGTGYYSWRSVDLLGNLEEWNSEINVLDCDAPVINIVDPQGSETEVDYCSIPLDIEIKDMLVGIDDNSVYAIVKDINGNEVSGPHSLIRDPAYDGNGQLFGGDKFYLPNNLDLDGLSSGNYFIEIYAEDLLNNGGLIQTENITLNDGIYARLTNGCSIGDAGGLCVLEYTACVRNASLMEFKMTKIFPTDGGPIADLSTLGASFHTDGGSGVVGQIKFDNRSLLDWTGDIVPFIEDDCEVVNGRIKFNVTLDFTQDLVATIGGGDYQFDWTAEAFLNDYKYCSTKDSPLDNF